MAVDKTPVLKRCRSLDLVPKVYFVLREDEIKGRKSTWIKMEKIRRILSSFFFPEKNRLSTFLSLLFALFAPRRERKPKCRRRPIFPCCYRQSIFGSPELNFRVRNGNGWTLRDTVPTFQRPRALKIEQQSSFRKLFFENRITDRYCLS